MLIKIVPFKQKLFSQEPCAKLLLAAFYLSCIWSAVPNSVLASSHGQLQTTPCDIRLVFGTDTRGLPSVAYKLSFQIRNHMARYIIGASVFWLDDDSTIVGNSDTICGVEGIGIGPSEAGQCETNVQKISGKLLKNLGQTTWTGIINHQLANFEQVKKCAILGYDYEDTKVKIY